MLAMEFGGVIMQFVSFGPLLQNINTQTLQAPKHFHKLEIRTPEIEIDGGSDWPVETVVWPAVGSKGHRPK